MSYLVTGASGFIGSALCADLQRAGVDFTAASQRGTTLADGSPTQRVDLGRADDVLRGKEAVCHLAGIAHQRASSADYRRVNVATTLDLARSAIRAGVRRFLFVSSIKAMGAFPAQRVAASAGRTEDEVYPAADAYGRSKWEAEQGLKALCAGTGMDLAILRPCLVYGPAPRGNLALLARGARYGMPRPPLGGERTLVGLADLVSLMTLLLVEMPAGQSTWIVTDGQRYTSRGLFDQLREAAGRPPARSWLPDSGWRFACAALDRLRGQANGSTHDKLFARDCYDSSRVLAETGWRPSQTFADVAPLMVPAS